MLHRLGSINELSLRGRGRELPWPIMAAFVAGALGLAALPPLGAFPGKALVEEAAIETGYGWVAVVFLIATILTSGGLLRAAGRIFLGWGRERELRDEHSDAEEETTGARGYTPVVMIVSAVALVLLGLVFATLSPVWDAVETAAARFTDRAGYAATVLTGRPPATVELEAPGAGPLEIVLGFAGVAGALLFAYAVLRRGAVLLTAAPPVSRPVLRGLFVLRRLHSGQIGDYVAWLVVGMAVFGGLLALGTVA
jgi:multicomponent Na+:H+ antiporter subunit D